MQNKDVLHTVDNLSSVRLDLKQSEKTSKRCFKEESRLVDGRCEKSSQATRYVSMGVESRPAASAMALAAVFKGTARIICLRIVGAETGRIPVRGRGRSRKHARDQGRRNVLVR